MRTSATEGAEHRGRDGALARRAFRVDLWRIPTLAAIYFAAGKLGLMLAVVHPSATAVWAPTGIALAAFLGLGYRVWPGILLGAFLVNATTAGSLATSLGIALGNTLEGLAGCYLVTRFAGGRAAFDRGRDVFKFAALAGLLSTTVAATFGVTSLCLGGYADWAKYGSIWLTWWLGDAAGALIVAPLLLLWGAEPRIRWTPGLALQAVLLLAALFVVGEAVFAGWLPVRDYPLEFLCIPIVVWAAFQLGRRAAVTATFLLSGISIWGTLNGFGPFANKPPNASLLLLQAYMSVLAVTALVLASAAFERKRVGETLLRTGEALRQDRDFITAVIDTSAALVVVLDPEGRIVRFNRACELTTGYALSEVQGKHFWDLFLPPEEVDPVMAVFRELTSGRFPSRHESSWVTRHGRRRLISWSNTMLPDGRGAVEYVIATGIDITERAKAEEDRRKSEATVRAFLESAGEGILITDREGRIVVANAKIEEMFGYGRDDLVGQTVEILLPERYRHIHVGHRANYLSAPRVRPMGLGLDLAGRRKNGTEFPVEISLSYMRTGDELFVMAFISDITERLALQRVARRVEKLTALGGLAAGIAHNFNNLLAIIGLRAQLLLESERDSERARGLRGICEATFEGAEMVRRIGEFTKTQQTGLLGSVDLPQLLREVVEVARPRWEGEAQRRGVSYGVRVEGGSVPPVQGNPEELREVFANLLGNALDAMPGGGQFVFDVSAAAGWIVVNARDSGCGMREEIRGRVFEPFFTTQASRGRGLGLATGWGIVTRHGGTIEVESAPGEGSTFTVRLPVGQPPRPSGDE